MKTFLKKTIFIGILVTTQTLFSSFAANAAKMTIWEEYTQVAHEYLALASLHQIIKTTRLTDMDYLTSFAYSLSAKEKMAAQWVEVDIRRKLMVSFRKKLLKLLQEDNSRFVPIQDANNRILLQGLVDLLSTVEINKIEPKSVSSCETLLTQYRLIAHTIATRMKPHLFNYFNQVYSPLHDRVRLILEIDTGLVAPELVAQANRNIEKVRKTRLELEHIYAEAEAAKATLARWTQSCTQKEVEYQGLKHQCEVLSQSIQNQNLKMNQLFEAEVASINEKMREKSAIAQIDTGGYFFNPHVEERFAHSVRIILNDHLKNYTENKPNLILETQLHARVSELNENQFYWFKCLQGYRLVLNLRVVRVGLGGVIRSQPFPILFILDRRGTPDADSIVELKRGVSRLLPLNADEEPSQRQIDLESKSRLLEIQLIDNIQSAPNTQSEPGFIPLDEVLEEIKEGFEEQANQEETQVMSLLRQRRAQ